MEHHPLHTLIALIEFDRQLIDRQKQIEQTTVATADLERVIRNVDRARQDAEKRVHHAKKLVHENELVMRELEEKEAEKKKQLDAITSQKEYEPLKKEITFLKKRQYDHEKLVVASWRDFETAQKEYEAATAPFNEKRAGLETQLKQLQEKMARLHEETARLEQERKPLEQNVPEEWRDKYNRMRTNTQNPIVPVEYDSCSGCFSQLSAQDLLDLKRHKLIQCTSCYRFVYLPEDAPTQPTA